ncbi:MAG TPA: endonuclease/exonuclease/phosphatase family protein [Rhodothermales bacterium]|nr:endonuclease/exonuclease/phosphatase family protein [Rhodothermales bacterium]
MMRRFEAREPAPRLPRFDDVQRATCNVHGATRFEVRGATFNPMVVVLPLVLSTLASACAIGGQLQSRQPTDDTLRVLTYNLHGLLQDGPNPDWHPVRTAWLLDAIQELDPDVVGFQEVLQTIDSDGSDNQIKTLADSLSRRTGMTWEYRSAMAHPSWERFDEGIAILSRHPFVSAQEYRLEAKDVFQRNALAARIQTPLGEIDFFTAHLAHRGEAELVRMAQVAEIKRAVGRRSADDPPAIIVGDFNAEPDRPSVQLATTADSMGRFIDAFSAVHPDAAGHTFSAREPSRRIDYVFVTDTTSLTPVRAEIIFDGTVDGIMLSDHLGVVVDFVPSPGASGRTIR